MAASFNRVILIGNLTGDPDLQYTSKGTARAKFSVAINRKYKGSNGEQQDDVTFVPITVWGRVAEVCAQYLVKGSSVMIEGRLRITSFENEDGEKRKYTEVVGEAIQFLGSPSGRGKLGEVDEEDEVPF